MTARAAAGSVLLTGVTDDGKEAEGGLTNVGNGFRKRLLSRCLAGGACSGGACAPLLTPLRATRAPLLATLRPGCLGLSI
jgi:hypothetical protein